MNETSSANKQNSFWGYVHKHRWLFVLLVLSLFLGLGSIALNWMPARSQTPEFGNRPLRDGGSALVLGKEVADCFVFPGSTVQLKNVEVRRFERGGLQKFLEGAEALGEDESWMITFEGEFKAKRPDPGEENRVFTMIDVFLRAEDGDFMGVNLYR